MASLQRGFVKAQNAVLRALQTSAAAQSGKGRYVFVSQHACFTKSAARFGREEQPVTRSTEEEMAKGEAEDFSAGATGLPSEGELVQDPWSDTNDRKEAWISCSLVLARGDWQCMHVLENKVMPILRSPLQIAERIAQERTPYEMAEGIELEKEFEHVGTMGSMDPPHEDDVLRVGPKHSAERPTEIAPEKVSGGSNLGTRVTPVRRFTTAALPWGFITGARGYAQGTHTRRVAAQKSAIAADKDFHFVQNADPDTFQVWELEGGEDEMMLNGDADDAKDGRGSEWQLRLDDNAAAEGWKAESATSEKVVVVDITEKDSSS